MIALKILNALAILLVPTQIHSFVVLISTMPPQIV